MGFSLHPCLRLQLGSLETVSLVQASGDVVLRGSAAPVLLRLSLALSLAGAGCGPVLQVTSLGRATEAVTEARAENAAVVAPYALRSAEIYLAQAETDAARGAYGDATAHAMTAERFAIEARTLALRESSEPSARSTPSPPALGTESERDE